MCQEQSTYVAWTAAGATADCPAPADSWTLPYSQLQNGGTQTAAVGGTQRYSCDADFSLSNEQADDVIACQAGGVWSQPTSTCIDQSGTGRVNAHMQARLSPFKHGLCVHPSYRRLSRFVITHCVYCLSFYERYGDSDTQQSTHIKLIRSKH